MNGIALRGNNFEVLGDLNGSFSVIGTLTWPKGDVTGVLTIPSGSTLCITGSDEKDLWAGRLVNYGRIVWEDGNLSGKTYQANVNTIENMPGAVFEIDGGLTMQSYGKTTSTGPGQFSFENAGTLRMSGTNTTEFQVGSFGGPFEFNNTGSIEVNAGNLYFRIPVTQESGEIILLSTLTSSQNIQLRSGRIGGSGMLNGDLLNSGGILGPGQSPGMLTVHGNYSQGSNGVLEVEIGGATPGTAYDQLVVSGDVVLNGRVTIQLVDSYTPSTGDPFNVISCGGALSGEFSEIAGVHVSRDVVFAPQYTTSIASLITRSSRPYEQWAWDEFGGQVHDPTVSTYFSDPERDGIVNVLEYAFALNPLLPDSGCLQSCDVVEDAAAQYLSVSFVRPTGATGLNYLPRVTGDLLGAWDSEPGSTQVYQVIDHGDTETVTIRDTVPIGSAAARFMTIGVEIVEE